MHHLLPLAPDNPPIATPASCPLPAATSSGLYPSHTIYQAADPDHNVHTPDSSVSTITLTVSIHALMDSTVVTHLNRSGICTP